MYRQRNGLYFQGRGWPSRKFQDEFQTAEFWQEYADILNDEAPPKQVNARNFGALVKDCRSSHRYKRLEPRTALDYDNCLDFLLSIMADSNPCSMKRKDVIKLRDANAEKAYFAN